MSRPVLLKVKPPLQDLRGLVMASADIDLDLAEAEVVGVLGESGSGKSTLPCCLAGVVPPDRGSVKIAMAATCPPICGGSMRSAVSARCAQRSASSTRIRATISSSASVPAAISPNRQTGPSCKTVGFDLVRAERRRRLIHVYGR
ncbi:ATP-binding cassette domain-containing protein [Bradyrhizobium sp. CNPSo 4026]|nr:ATP-binding cassette domain-containing protein [Bradyrhizobium cenepequi]